MAEIGLRRKFNPILRVFFILCGFFISIFILILLIPTIFILNVWSAFAYFIRKIQHGSHVSSVHKIDKTHCTNIGNSYSYINAPVRFKGKLDIGYIKNRIKETTYGCTDLDQRKRFRRISQVMKPSLLYSYYMDDPNFNIDNHVYEVNKEELFPQDISQPMLDDEAVNNMEWENVACKMLYKYGVKPVNAGPQWEMIFYQETGESFIGLLRFHHQITDGVNYVRFLCETLADDDVAIGTMPYKYNKQNVVIRFFRWLLNFCIFPFAVFDMALIGKTMKVNQLHGNKLTGEKHYALSKPVPMDIVKSIKKATGTTLNAIFFSAYSQALAKYFDRVDNTVKNCWLLFPMPKNNIRDPVQFVNRFHYSFVNLPIHSLLKLPKDSDKKSRQTLVPLTDPSLERLYNIKRYLNLYRRDHFVGGVIFVLEMVYATFPLPLLKKVITNRGFLSIYSSVAASPKKFALFNAMCEEVTFLGFDQNPNGMFFSIIGYNERLRAGLMVDSGLIGTKEEVQQILDDFVDEILNIHESLQSH